MTANRAELSQKCNTVVVLTSLKDLKTFKPLLLLFQLLSRRNALHERAMYRRAQLADSFHLQQFFRDSDELKSWVNEKMKTATDEAYKVNTKTNVRVILRQYQA